MIDPRNLQRDIAMTEWAAVIRRVAPTAKPQIVAMIANHAEEQFAKRNIRSMRRQASIIAHMAVETGWFTTLEENLNYSASRLCDVWPRRFRTINEAMLCAHNPEAIAKAVYNGRMGNRWASDDGWVFRGKGLLQCTGRENTEKLASELGVSPETAAAWLTDPEHALECACVLYNMLNVGPAADADNMTVQTKRVNGGLLGLADRKKAYDRAMRALSAQTAATVVGPRNPEPDGDAALDAVTAVDLRDSGSRTILGADSIKSSLSGILTSGAAASGALSQVQDVAQQASDAKEAIVSGVSLIDVLKDYWPVLALILFVIIALFFAWRVYHHANEVIDSRVDDARTGANIGR